MSQESTTTTTSSSSPFDSPSSSPQKKFKAQSIFSFTPTALKITPTQKSEIKSSRKNLTKSPSKSLQKSPTKSPKKTPSKMTQLFIDLGQKDFGHTVCPVCSMPYNKALPEDELVHQKYHKNFEKGISYPGWKDENIVSEEDNLKIILISDSSSQTQKKKVDFNFSYFPS